MQPRTGLQTREVEVHGGLRDGWAVAGALDTEGQVETGGLSPLLERTQGVWARLENVLTPTRSQVVLKLLVSGPHSVKQRLREAQHITGHSLLLIT